MGSEMCIRDSPSALPTPLKCRTCAQLYSRPSNSLGNLRCRAADLISAAPSRRLLQASFSERAKKSAHLCGEMRVHFCLPKLCCLTKRQGRAHKNPPNGCSRRNLMAAFSPDALPKHSRMNPSRPALEALTPKAKMCAEIVPLFFVRRWGPESVARTKRNLPYTNYI